MQAVVPIFSATVFPTTTTYLKWRLKLLKECRKKKPVIKNAILQDLFHLSAFQTTASFFRRNLKSFLFFNRIVAAARTYIFALSCTFTNGTRWAAIFVEAPSAVLQSSKVLRLLLKKELVSKHIELQYILLVGTYEKMFSLLTLFLVACHLACVWCVLLAHRKIHTSIEF